MTNGINTTKNAIPPQRDQNISAGCNGGQHTVTSNTVVLGVRAPDNCLAADVGAQGGLPGRDGQLDNNDFIVFIDEFFNQTACP